MLKAGFISLGCSKNLVDTEVMLGILAKNNVEITPEPAKADILIVNTCTFIQSAKEESITTILNMAEYKQEGKKVMMIAADTFRAGAVAQLEEWATRTESLFYGSENTDPSGVIYDGLEIAKKENVDLVFIDTAGRLQNKVNLMKELEKMNRVIGKIIPDAPHETLLVIDATTGQNGIVQAESFKEITKITGIVLTKLDGTAKGGIVLAIKENVGIPVKFIGLGEKMTDLKVFDIESYIYGLFKDMI